jgi:hypothetical protein
VKRETRRLDLAGVMAGYLFALAYLASFVTYRCRARLGGVTGGRAAPARSIV